MRFAWLRQHTEDQSTVDQAFFHPLALLRKAYNLAFWVFLLPFFSLIPNQTGFLAFSIIIGVRLLLNLYTNNANNLTPQQYDAFPFRP
jgi:hypothetical protein